MNKIKITVSGCAGTGTGKSTIINIIKRTLRMFGFNVDINWGMDGGQSEEYLFDQINSLHKKGTNIVIDEVQACRRGMNYPPPYKPPININQERALEELKPLIIKISEWERDNGTAACLIRDKDRNDIAKIVSEWSMEYSFRTIESTIFKEVDYNRRNT